jgi:prepilin-type N-terminal cleavage/methylation domain-containing protein
MKKYRIAFTLIELLVVIAIIGILSGLIVVSMSGVTNKASIAKAQIFSNSLRNSLMADIVSEWKFDGSGVSDGGTVTTAYTQDTWGANVGAVNGTPKVYSDSSCLSGSCIFLNGSTDFISHAVIHFADLSPYTFSVWLKWGTTVPSTFVVPFGYGAQVSPNIYFTQSGSKTFLYRGSGQSGTSIVNSNNLSLFNGNWHNVVWTIDSSRNAKFYIDGVQDGNTTVIAGSTEMFYRYIGYGYNGNTYMWNGYVDELRIFSDVMPSSKVKEQYYAGLNNLLTSGSISIEDYQSRLLTISKK